MSKMAFRQVYNRLGIVCHEESHEGSAMSFFPTNPSSLKNVALDNELVESITKLLSIQY